MQIWKFLEMTSLNSINVSRTHTPFCFLHSKCRNQGLKFLCQSWPICASRWVSCPGVEIAHRECAFVAFTFMNTNRRVERIKARQADYCVRECNMQSTRMHLCNIQMRTNLFVCCGGGWGWMFSPSGCASTPSASSNLLIRWCIFTRDCLRYAFMLWFFFSALVEYFRSRYYAMS